MSIILSHSTARAVYQTFKTPPLPEEPTIDVRSIGRTRPKTADIYEATLLLKRWKADCADLECCIFSRTQGTPSPNQKATVHYCVMEPEHSDIIHLDCNVYIVGIEMCALQAARSLDFLELVEYYYEICGSYSLDQGVSNYIERPALTSTVKLKRFLLRAKSNGLTGSRDALCALSYVRDGCRSPMETAFSILLVVPKRYGGLGIRGYQTNYEITVSENARMLTRRMKFFLDGYLESSKTDIEYNGFYHESDDVAAIDEERRLALASMGYGIIIVSRHTFFDAAAFRRIMTAIQRRQKITPSKLPAGFSSKQDELRRFVLRRYIEESKTDETRMGDGQHQGHLACDEISDFEAAASSDMQIDTFIEPEGTTFGALTT